MPKWGVVEQGFVGVVVVLGFEMKGFWASGGRGIGSVAPRAGAGLNTAV